MPEGVRGPARPPARATPRYVLSYPLTIIAAFCGTAVPAQQSDKPRPEQHAGEAGSSTADIVVTGSRGFSIADIEPLATLDANAGAATGDTTMSELLLAIR